jgi:hypothetical protein
MPRRQEVVFEDETDQKVLDDARQLVDPLVSPAANPPPDEILPPARSYRQRIRILEAFQYHGRLGDAPGWVDRNWAAWGDYDPLRNIPAGPAVRVPDDPGNPGGTATLARVGDYIVSQEVAIADGISDVRVEVWAREQFEKFFIPFTDPPPGEAPSGVS